MLQPGSAHDPGGALLRNRETYLRWARSQQYDEESVRTHRRDFG